MTEMEMKVSSSVVELCRKEIVLRSKAILLVNFLIVEKKIMAFVISARECANKENGMKCVFPRSLCRILDVNSEESEDRSSAIHFWHNLRVWGRFIVRGFRQRPQVPAGCSEL